VFSAITAIAGICSGIGLMVPKRSSELVIGMSLLISIVFFGSTLLRRDALEQQINETCEATMKRFKVIIFIRTFVCNVYILSSIFFTPFSNKYFLTYGVTSLSFAIQYAFINKYYFSGAEYYIKTSLYDLGWMMVMFLLTYSTRRVLMQFFVSQTEAEKTSRTLT